MMLDNVLRPSSTIIDQLKIVDPETQREVAFGEVGEIWISSPSVAAGYWGLPELTEQAFSARVVDGEEGGESSDTTTVSG